MKKVEDVYRNYLSEKSIRRSAQREKILEIFLGTNNHISVADLYDRVKRKYPGIGQATVYRSMKLLCDAGIAEEIDLGDGMKRFEHKLGHDHHDHLYCVSCGKIIEVLDPGLEALQEKMCRKSGFEPIGHTLRIFGYCDACSKRR